MCIRDRPLLSGRLSGKKKSLIRDLVKENDLNLRLTPNQDILLCDISNKNKSKIKKALKKIGYDKLDDLEKTIQPLLEFWKKSSAEKDFGDFINNQTESFITNLLSEIN